MELLERRLAQLLRLHLGENRELHLEGNPGLYLEENQELHLEGNPGLHLEENLALRPGLNLEDCSRGGNGDV